MSNISDAVYKTIIIGDANTGKTCIFRRFIENEYTDRRAVTIGVDFSFKTLSINGMEVKLQIWDTAGQEQYQSLTRQYWLGSQIIIIVYDVTNRDSFDNIDKWLDETKEILNNWQETIIAIVGNKCDLADRDVEKEEALNFAQQNGFFYFETSAKTGENVENLFLEVSESAFKQSHPTIRPNHSFSIDPNVKRLNETWLGTFKSYCSIL